MGRIKRAQFPVELAPFRELSTPSCDFLLQALPARKAGAEISALSLTKEEGTSRYWGGHQQPLPQYLRPILWVACLPGSLEGNGAKLDINPQLPWAILAARGRVKWVLGPEDRVVLEMKQPLKGAGAEWQ